MPTTTPCIVVGYDGSPASRATRPVTAVPAHALRANTDDDRGETRMETDGAAPRVAS